MADTGIPLLITLCGLLVAYLFFRSQLKSDRVLRRADFSQSVASPLGEVMVSASDEFRKYVWNSKEWRYFTWPAGKVVLDAVHQAQLRLSGFDSFNQFVVSTAILWRGCYQGAIEENALMEAHQDTIREILDPYMFELLIVGRELVSWDGEGAAPGELRIQAFLSSHGELSVERDESPLEWAKSEYKAKLRRHSKDYDPKGPRFNDQPPLARLD